MIRHIWSGMLLVALGGAFQGSFTMPQKYVRGWAWEKTWLLYSVFGMIVFPWLGVAMLIPHAATVYSMSRGEALLRTALFGFGWGVGSVLFGLGIVRVGLAMAFAIIISLAAGTGSLVPLAVLHPDNVLSKQGGYLILGLLLVGVGLFLYSRAGALREATGRMAGFAATTSYRQGILICVASGVLSALINFSFVFGDPIAAEATRQGALPGSASLAIFAFAVAAGFLANAGYCVYLLVRNQSWQGQIPASTKRNGLFAVAMGALWVLGYIMYGRGIALLGEPGAAIGWPLFMIVMVAVANLWSVVSGEWRGAGRQAHYYLASGMSVMLLALLVIAAGA